jgi:hypothetical protein
MANAGCVRIIVRMMHGAEVIVTIVTGMVVGLNRLPGIAMHV